MGFEDLTPRSRAKREQIREAARGLFLEGGFAGTSVDAISAGAGVSKATVYSHYPAGKEELLEDVLRRTIGEGPQGWLPGSPEEAPPLEDEGELRGELVRLGREMISTFMRPEYLALARLIVAETPRFPQLGELFRSVVPARGLESILTVLERAREGGAARYDDAETAARMFGGTLLTYVLLDGLLVGDGPPRPPEPEQIEAVVNLYVKSVAVRESGRASGQKEVRT